jgi:hypothetical protein
VDEATHRPGRDGPSRTRWPSPPAPYKRMVTGVSPPTSFLGIRNCKPGAWVDLPPPVVEVESAVHEWQIERFDQRRQQRLGSRPKSGVNGDVARLREGRC